MRYVFLILPAILIGVALCMVIAPRASLMRLRRLQGQSVDPGSFDDRTINAVLVTGMILLGSGLIALVGGLAATVVLDVSPGTHLITRP